MQLPLVIRRLTIPLVGRVPVPIASGANRGMWWSLASAGSGHATGRRTSRQLRLVQALLREGETMWDVGAHHGYVSLCASRRVGPGGRVHAFEPSAGNRWFLERHVAWNSARNVVIHREALGAADGEARFGGRGTSRTLAIGRGDEVVQVRTAASVLAAGLAPPPTFVKVDVEGAEGDVLAGALPALPPAARLLVAVHSRAQHDECAARLREAGWRVVPSRGVAECLAAGRWRSDPDLFAMGPACGDAAAQEETLRRFAF